MRGAGFSISFPFTEVGARELADDDDEELDEEEEEALIGLLVGLVGA